MRAVEAVSLASLTGTWRRRWVRRADGREDGTTEVWWVQAGRFYGDLRLPRVGGAEPEGFAGELVERDGVFEWRRAIDLRPTGKRDVGRLRYVDAGRKLMIEEGAEEAYSELWERAGLGEGPVVMRKEGEWFVGAGEDFVLAVNRGEGEVEVSYGRRDPGGEDGTVTASSISGREGGRAFGAGGARSGGWRSVAVW